MELLTHACGRERFYSLLFMYVTELILSCLMCWQWFGQNVYKDNSETLKARLSILDHLNLL